MSKKKVKEPTQDLDYVSELLDKGTVILTAKTREELAEMTNNIPASCRYGAGAVGRNRETGLFTLRLDIINE